MYKLQYSHYDFFEAEVNSLEELFIAYAEKRREDDPEGIVIDKSPDLYKITNSDGEEFYVKTGINWVPTFNFTEVSEDDITPHEAELARQVEANSKLAITSDILYRNMKLIALHAHDDPFEYNKKSTLGWADKDGNIVTPKKFGNND